MVQRVLTPMRTERWLLAEHNAKLERAVTSPTDMLSLLARRLVRLWPELAATLTA